MNLETLLLAIGQAKEEYLREAGEKRRTRPAAEADPAPIRRDAIQKEAVPVHQETAPQRRRRQLGLAAAALALVLVSGGAWALLRNGNSPGGALSGREPPISGELEAITPEPAPLSSEYVWPTATREPDDSIDDISPIPEITPDPELEQALLELKIGGLYLGQPQEEVRALYGEPRYAWDSPIVNPNGTRLDSWSYYFVEDQSLHIDFVDAGDGFVVNQILCAARLEGEMPLGIQIGMPFDEAEAAFAQSPILNAVKHRTDDNLMEFGMGNMEGSLYAVVTDIYTGQPGHLRLDVSYCDQAENGPHYVNHISLGTLYADWVGDDTDPTIDPEARARQDRFESGEITVWLPEDGGWQGQTFQNEEAKAISMEYAISLPESWDYDGSAPIALLDFHTDAVVQLYDAAGHAGIYHLRDRAAFAQGLAAGDPGRGLELWEYGCLGPGVLPVTLDPFAQASDWDLNHAVGAKLQELIAAARAKGAALFVSTDGKVLLFREKGHYVIAGAFAGGEEISAYGEFYEDHTELIRTVDFPMIDPTPEKLMGMDYDELRAMYGEPAFETLVDGVSCPGYVTSGGYLAILRLRDGTVAAMELYDHSDTAMHIAVRRGSVTIPYQPGDTTPTWDPALAANYPADENCSPALLLEKWMAVEGLTMADLDARGCCQLILTAAQPGDGTETVTVCFERGEDGVFYPVPRLDRLAGYVGKNGVRHDRRRDSLCSPAGLWTLGTAFGNELPPEGLKLPWRQVTPNSDWVCDSDSPYFNSWQERDDPDLEPWSDDVEHLEDYPTQYAWACVIGFNLPPDAVPDRGCAIFLHCSERATAGCVGLAREDMVAVLQWLDPEKRPYILISGEEMAGKIGNA